MKRIILCMLLISPLLMKTSIGAPFIIKNGKECFLTNDKIKVFEDQNNKLRFSQIRSAHFYNNEAGVPSFGLSNNTYWLKFSVSNHTDEDQLLLYLSNPLLDSVSLFYPDSEGNYIQKFNGYGIPTNIRQYNTQDFIFNLPISSKDSALLFLKVRSRNNITLPIYVGTRNKIIKHVYTQNIIFGTYIGIICIMIIYNLFIFISVRDKDYLFYVLYVAAIGFTQICLGGYGSRFLWGHSTFFTEQSTNLSGVLSGITTILFTISFLRTKKNLFSFDRFLRLIIVIYIISLFISLAGKYNLSYTIVNITSALGSLVVIINAIILAIKGNKSAIYYSLALSVFLVSVILYIIKTTRIIVIPYNLFTDNILLLGSTLEVALLSFALADKINTYRKEKEISQKRALEAAREKELFIRQQNVVLERKVKNRTRDLELLNEDLSNALKKLKNAQSQLVEAEKMSSLGQLTAGIAHEINNPINFIKSNIKPLELDIEDLFTLLKKKDTLTEENFEEKTKEIKTFEEEIDIDYLKEEIPQILSAIADGATRTTDIVQGLRSFSRLDEAAIKKANIHEGLDRTLVLLNGKIPNNMKVVKDYGEIPEIECYPGKLNQVFMNILSNAIQAMTGDEASSKEKILTIRTRTKQDQVIVLIEDNGYGIPQEVKEKIFDPFFTTKEVGEGTGLGLSISYSIIEEHHGTIEVFSEKGKGTQFKLTLPVHSNE